MRLEHERIGLACGATLLARPLTSNEIVSIRSFLPMGPLFEADEEAGVSALVQSVLPRGTVHRSAHQVQEELAALGASLDAGTGRDLGSVSLRATTATWEPALDLYLESVTEPGFAEEEVATEIEQTLGALEAREDNLLVRAMDLFRERFYAGHPLHKPPIGYRDTVRAMDRERVVAAARGFYRPVPSVVVAVGRFDPERLAARLDQAFGTIPLAQPVERPVPPRPGAGTARLALDREAAYLVVGFPAPDLTDPDYPAGLVLEAILGGSMASRLFIELREKRALGYQVSSIYSDRLEGSFMAGYIVTDPGRAGEAADGLERQFRRLAEEPVETEELDSARRYLKGVHLIRSERNAAQAGRLGRLEAYGLGHDFSERWLTAIDAISPEAIRDLARRMTSLEATRALVVPEPALAG